MVDLYQNIDSYFTTLSAIWYLCFAFGVLLMLMYCSNYLQLQCIYIDILKGSPKIILQDGFRSEENLLFIKDDTAPEEKLLKGWHIIPPPKYSLV